MTKCTRTLLFLFCGLIFVLVAPSVILYSQGYRLDRETKRITQIGALYLDATPKQADVFINGIHTTRTNRFVGTALVENLVPGHYTITVSKDGFRPWQKTLPVEAKQVTEVQGIILFPAKLELSKVDALEAKLLSFSPAREPLGELPPHPLFRKASEIQKSPNKKQFILLVDREIWLFDGNGATFITRFGEEIANLRWLGDRHVLFATKTAVLAVEIDTRDRPNIADIARIPEPKILWDSQNKTLYIKSEGTVFASTRLAL